MTKSRPSGWAWQRLLLVLPVARPAVPKPMLLNRDNDANAQKEVSVPLKSRNVPASFSFEFMTKLETQLLFDLIPLPVTGTV